MNVKTGLLAAAALAAFAGCRTNKDILIDYEKDLVAGNYEHATVEVTGKAEDTGVDQLMWLLHAGGAEHLTGDGEAAIGNFDKAEDIYVQNDAQSLFAKAGSGTMAMMSNDRALPFIGGGQDRVFTCFYKAVDYAAAQNVDAARTELNRAAQHQQNWIYERRKDIDAAREKMKESAKEYAEKEKAAKPDEGTDQPVDKAMADESFAAQIRAKTGFDPTCDGRLENLSQKDYLNVYVQHVCGVFRWVTDGSGTDYFKGLPELNPGCGMLRRDLREGGSGKPKNQVWLYVEDGLCPCREEWRLDLPLVLIPYANKYIMYAGMAIPYLRYRDAAVAEYRASYGGKWRKLELLQDMDRLLKVEHDVYMRGALAREIARTIIKVAVQVGLGVASDATNNNYAKYSLKASQVAAAVWAASVTQADLRSWTGLPKQVFACRFDRPADGKVELKDGSGNVLATAEVPAGNTMVFVSKPSAQAAPAVKVVTLPN